MPQPFSGAAPSASAMARATPDLAAFAERLRRVRPGDYHVVTLPDFYLDHFVKVGPWRETVAAWSGVHDRGGGNVPTPAQHLQPGGNAANAALALARLGVRTHLVTRTSDFGKAWLDATLARHGVDLKHAKGGGRLSITTAIEFEGERPANLMLSDPGSVAEYGPEALDANDWTLVEAADLVLVANWSQNRRGTALVDAVARAARKAGTLTMVDAADPSHRRQDLPELKEKVLGLAELDVFALNENELRLLAGRALAEGDEERRAARALHALRPEGVLDLHTARFAATWGAWGEAWVPTFRVRPRRVTGAGDAWNAGDVLGHLAGLPPEDRLLLANAVAALSIAEDAPDALPPTLADVLRFVESGPSFSP